LKGKYTPILAPLRDSIGGQKIIERIRKSEDRLSKKVAKKEKEEQEYYDERYGFKEEGGKEK
jgi:hypothetical protein